MCQFDWDVFWSAFSAIATAAAVIVALWLAHKQGTEAKRERDEAERLRIVSKLEFVCSVARYAQDIYEHAAENFENFADAFCPSADTAIYADTEFAVRDMPAHGLPSGELVVMLHRVKVNFGVASKTTTSLIEMGRSRGFFTMDDRLSGSGAQEAKERLEKVLAENKVLIERFQKELTAYSRSAI